MCLFCAVCTHVHLTLQYLAQAAVKLKGILQQNPRRLRPTLSRAHKRRAAALKSLKCVKTEPANKQLALSTEVWEIESDSDVECLDPPGVGAMDSSGSPAGQDMKAWTECGANACCSISRNACKARPWLECVHAGPTSGARQPAGVAGFPCCLACMTV